MATPGKSLFWRRCRTCFLWCRICGWLAILVLFCALAYLSWIGLPEFAKGPVLEALRERGVDLEFSHLHLRWFQGIVAEDVRFGQSDDPAGPELTARQVELDLSLAELMRLRLGIDAVRLHQGRFEWRLGDTNTPTPSLLVENIETTLRLLPGDQWSLDDFRGQFAGARFTLSASVTNASAVRDWKFLHARQPAEPGAWRRRLQRLTENLEKISFVGQPELHFTLSGDARDPQSFSGRLTCHAQGAETPWGRADRVLVSSRLAPGSNGTTRVELRLEARQIQTRWGGGLGIHLNADGTILPDLPIADPAWGWWTNLQPYRLNWSLQTDAVHVDEASVSKLVLAGRWEAPVLSVSDLHLEWRDAGDLDATAQLDVPTRRTDFQVTAGFDLNRIAPLLSEKTREWLAKYKWGVPPHVRGAGAVVLPAWTSQQVDWQDEVQPTLQLAGEMAITNCSYLDVPADWARFHFTYSNMVWRLPDLEIARPEGRIHLVHVQDDRSKDYYWHVQGPVDPRAFRDLMPTNAQRDLDRFSFNSAPVVDAEVLGRLYARENLGISGRLSLSNFSYRGQSADYVESRVQYTNRVLDFFEPHLWRSGQVMTASVIHVDFPAGRIHFTNGYSTAEPQVVARIIGPMTAEAMEPYRFTRPPTVFVEGYAPLHGERDADLHFTVAGGPFEWLRLRVKWITGNVHWYSNYLTLTNLQAPFYEGEAWGSAVFDFETKEGTDFRFFTEVSDADLSALMRDVNPRTNQLEGRLSGTLTVTNANSRDNWSWQGFGRARLRDGLIWDIPIFGVLSPVLNSIVPGLGTSRASEATGKFVITNSVLRTDDLEIRSPMLWLQYGGTVDYLGRVDALVEGEPLRDAWLLGRIVSLALTPVSKLFQYRVTGTLAEPVGDPVYIPKALFFPFRPISTIEEMFQGEPGTTNAPPEIPPQPQNGTPAMPEQPQH